jgi:hypothetical protein
LTELIYADGLIINRNDINRACWLEEEQALVIIKNEDMGCRFTGGFGKALWEHLKHTSVNITPWEKCEFCNEWIDPSNDDAHIDCEEKFQYEPEDDEY